MDTTPWSTRVIDSFFRVVLGISAAVLVFASILKTMEWRRLCAIRKRAESTLREIRDRAGLLLPPFPTIETEPKPGAGAGTTTAPPAPAQTAPPNCPAYGRYMIMAVGEDPNPNTRAIPTFIYSGGNQCGFILGVHSPCLMEMGGQIPDWRRCDVICGLMAKKAGPEVGECWG